MCRHKLFDDKLDALIGEMPTDVGFIKDYENWNVRYQIIKVEPPYVYVRLTAKGKTKNTIDHVAVWKLRGVGSSNHFPLGAGRKTDE